MKNRAKLIFLFDIGGVLIKWKGNDPIFRYIAKSYCVPFLEMKSALLENFDALESGKISSNEWIARALAKFGREIEPNGAGDRLLLAPFTPRAKMNQGTKRIVDLLHRKGFKIFALTNTSLAHLDYMKKVGWDEPFDGFFSSCELGCLKPDPLIFEKTLKLMRASPSQVVYVDDKQENVLGAKRFGIRHSIRFRSVSLLKEEIFRIVQAEAYS